MSTNPTLGLARLEAILESISQICLVVVGDVVLDEYLWGEVDRISPEAPVPVVHVQRESVVLGGAGNVARNVIALGGRCVFCTIVGDDADGDQVRELVEELGLDSTGVLSVPRRRTTRKTRVVASSQQVVRVDRETPEPISEEVGERLRKTVAEMASGSQGAVFEDYGKGVFSPELTPALIQTLAELELPVAVDPKGELEAFRGASLVKPNLREAERLAGLRVRGRDDLARVADQLREQLGGSALVITRGGAGMTVFDGVSPGVDVPTMTRSVFDVQGAGDTAIAALALSMRAGATLLEAAVIANCAAGAVVAKVGTATASRAEVCEQLPTAIAAVRERS